MPVVPTRAPTRSSALLVEKATISIRFKRGDTRAVGRSYADRGPGVLRPQVGLPAPGAL